MQWVGLSVQNISR